LLKSKHIESNRENSVFQLFFLLDDEDQDIEVVEVREIDFEEVKKRLEKGESVFIEVVEVREIDFEEVKKRLEKGESVFITRKRKQKLEPILVAGEETADPWYFYHI